MAGFQWWVQISSRFLEMLQVRAHICCAKTHTHTEDFPLFLHQWGLSELWVSYVIIKVHHLSVIYLSVDVPVCTAGLTKWAKAVTTESKAIPSSQTQSSQINFLLALQGKRMSALSIPSFLLHLFINLSSPYSEKRTKWHSHVVLRIVCLKYLRAVSYVKTFKECPISPGQSAVRHFSL